MKNIFRNAILITVFFCSCSTTKITSSWKEPNTHLFTGEWNKILVVALLKNETNRRKVEEELLNYLNGKGIVSYKYLNDDFNKIDEVKFRNKIKADGFDGAITLRLIDIDKEKVEMWKHMFKSWGKTVIGITTKGGTFRTNSKGRELTEQDLQPLLKRKDIQLVSIDYSVERKIDGVRYFEFATDAKDYDETASIIAACDMVLGVNTTALHCSAAMGVKTWCLVPKYHQWRYGQASMPWYRSMRLIYQDDKKWSEVVENVASQL